MLKRLREPLDPELRASLMIVVAMRWMLIAAVLFVVNYRPGNDARTLAVLNLLALGGAALNAILHDSLRRRRPIPAALPAFVGVYDAAAVTGAITAADGFDNQGYLLYYPALLAFNLAFPGRWGLLYSAAIALAYCFVSLPTHGSFDAGSSTDQKTLVLRLTTMAATVLIADLTVRIERQRRRRAVTAETARAEQVLQLEARARDLERRSEAERQRLSREIHDGISQNVYMLALGLETAAEVVARETHDEALTDRMSALVRLAKQTLLESRNLLFDLERVMTGRTSLTALIRNQAQEFSAVTGTPVEVTATGDERPLSPAAVGEVYRVVQEGLANIYKHARARRACIALDYGCERLTLEISDDGAGFDPADARDRGHGLSNMRQRAAALGGRLEIRSAAGSGATLTVTIPHVGMSDGDDPGVAR